MYLNVSSRLYIFYLTYLDMTSLLVYICRYCMFMAAIIEYITWFII